jgi:hypothetical protein
MANGVRVGVEWTNVFHHNDRDCAQADLKYSADVAEGFLLAMRSYGHDDIFDWGNDNAWPSDFDHPDFGGDSLNWSDNVHFCYFAGHGGQFHFDDKAAFNIGFSSRHNPPDHAPCRSISPQWELGAKRLKWFAIDSCDIVADTAGAHIVEAWGGPMRGVHLILGFIHVQRVGPTTRNRRISFAFDICRGVPIANAWLDWGYAWENPNEEASRPIAIAAGSTRDEAIARREGETLGWIWYDVRATNWLAWKWRG